MLSAIQNVKLKIQLLSFIKISHFILKNYRTQDAVTVPLFNIRTQFLGYFKIFGESEAVFHDIKRF